MHSKQKYPFLTTRKKHRITHHTNIVILPAFSTYCVSIAGNPLLWRSGPFCVQGKALTNQAHSNFEKEVCRQPKRQHGPPRHCSCCAIYRRGTQTLPKSCQSTGKREEACPQCYVYGSINSRPVSIVFRPHSKVVNRTEAYYSPNLDC